MQPKELLTLAEEFGSPLYVYDAATIEHQYNRLKNAFSKVENLRINYAMKALSNLSILKLMKKYGPGLDTVSIQEVQLGLHAGFSPDSIIFTPNGVSFEEIEAAAELGVQINIDNLSILEHFGTKHPKIPVCIRINPHVMAGGNENISVGHIDSKFGISIYQVPHILRIVENTGMHINGIHMHTGSDILDIEVFLYAAEILFDTAKQFKELDFLDFGSGFKGPYKKLSPLYFQSFLRVQCLTCRMGSFPCHSLPTSLLSSLLPVLARARTCQSCDTNARFPRAFFRIEALNAVLHVSELSDQLDVTLENSKIVKLALTWVATTQSDAIK